MDKSLVNVLRSVRADSGEQADEFTEVQDILMSNRIKVRVFDVHCLPHDFVLQQGFAHAGSCRVC